MATYVVHNIKYDTDGQTIDLPDSLEIEVPDDEECIEEYLSNEISNRTGFCHFGFMIVGE